MSHPLRASIEAQIRAAESRGELSNLAGAGKPIDLDTPGTSTLDKIMQEARVKPAALEYAEKASELRRDLAKVRDPDTRRRLMTKIAELETRANMEREALFRFG